MPTKPKVPPKLCTCLLALAGKWAACGVWGVLVPQGLACFSDHAPSAVRTLCLKLHLRALSCPGLAELSSTASTSSHQVSTESWPGGSKLSARRALESQGPYLLNLEGVDTTEYSHNIGMYVSCTHACILRACACVSKPVVASVRTNYPSRSLPLPPPLIAPSLH